MHKGKALALELIAICKAEKNTTLNLGNLALTEIPEEVLELKWLENISLGFLNAKGNINNINSFQAINKLNDYSSLISLLNLQFLNLSTNEIVVIKFLENLTNLKSLNLSSSEIMDISFLQKLMNLESLSLNSSKIADYNFLQNLTNLKSLNLNSNQILDYSFLQSLTNLKSLNLSSNRISDISFLENLTNLESLNLSSNQITDISFLQNLINLKSLNINTNQISDISFLKNLINLKSLNLNTNQVLDVSFLQNLINLTSLSLNTNRISDISFLQGLTNLKSLNLGSNHILDISYLQNLTNLESLNLSFNQITDISFLQRLINLEFLNLSSNQISDISFLQKSNKLQLLILFSNQISDISFLQKLSKLEYLDLSFNQISDIKILKNLIHLKNLDIRYNQVVFFTKSLLQSLKLRSLFLRDNPIQNFPSEIYNQHNCLEDARNWYQDIAKDGTINTELKIILLGNGRVGKTSIVKRWLGEAFDKKEESTHAIHVRNWKKELKISDNEQKQCTIRIWDFGGQDIYHSTHRYFMQSRALFVLVWDWKTEHQKYTNAEISGNEDVQFENFPLVHWIDYISTLGKNSPVIIVQNKINEHGVRPVPDQNELAQIYPEIKHYIPYSAETNQGFEVLESAIKESLEKMPELGMEMPKSWDDVRKAILKAVNKLEKKKRQQKKIKQSERFISYKKFIKICEANEVNEKSQDSLLRYLHNTGALFYQKDLFQNRIILDQSWAIEAIYTLFDRNDLYFDLLKSKQGQFDRTTLDKCWKKHSKEERDLFLSFMKSCELCFEIEKKDKQPIFIAPQLLPKKKPPLVEDFWENRPNTLHLIFHHRFLHRAVIHRFIVRVGHLADIRAIWFNGISFKYANTVAIIEVKTVSKTVLGDKSKEEKEVISVRVNGAKAKELLSLIRHEFKDIHNDVVKPEVLISINNQDWLAYDEMMRLKGKIPQTVALNGEVIQLDNLNDFVLIEKPFQEVKKHSLTEKVKLESTGIEAELLKTPVRFKDLIREESINQIDGKTLFLYIGEYAKDDKRLWHQNEVNLIKENFKNYPSIEWAKEEAVTFNKFQELLSIDKYTYLYYAGHSSTTGGLHLQDKNGQKHMIQDMNVFKHARNTKLKCVIFCSCNSSSFAPVIAQHIPYVIAMNTEIRDKFAEEFAGGFSLGIAIGKGVPESFEMGIERIKNNIGRVADIPVLYSNGKVHK